MNEKKCTKCNFTLDISLFYQYNGYYNSRCKTCSNIASKNNWHKNKHKYPKKYRKPKVKTEEEKRLRRIHRAAIYKRANINDLFLLKLAGYCYKLISFAKAREKAAEIENFIGCESSYFINYIKSRFIQNMNFDMLEKGVLHIVHIPSVGNFDSYNEEELKKYYHYSNFSLSLEPSLNVNLFNLIDNVI